MEKIKRLHYLKMTKRKDSPNQQHLQMTSKNVSHTNKSLFNLYQ